MIAKEGYPFIVISFIPLFIFGFLGVWWLFAVAVMASFFVVWFFRDPERAVPQGADSIVSPADGRVIKVEKRRDERFLKDDCALISIFMNVFNVHVNRAPADGKIIGIFYNPGKFISANLDKASLENEQNALLMEAKNGKRFVANQIAGLIARRIVCRVKEGTELKKGERFGLIRFGSRVDVYLPAGSKIEVNVGDKVKAGSSIIARW